MATPTSTNTSPQSFDMQKFFLPPNVAGSSPSPAPSHHSQVPQPYNQASGVVAPNSVVSPQQQMMGPSHQLLPSSSYPPPTIPGSHHPQPPFPSSYAPNFRFSPVLPPDHPSSQMNPMAVNPNLHHSVNPLHYGHPQRSISFPTPALQPQSQMPPVISSQHFSPDRSGAEIMALLRPSAPPNVPSMFEIPPYPQMPSIIRIPSVASAKQPHGRRISSGQSVVEYDVDVRMPNEMQPQLEVTPITKYFTDPQLCLGRQIAVNKTYISYGLKQGSIRVLNINTALRSLFRTKSQRVNDMAFFAEDVHLLATAGVDGRIVVWKISEGVDEEENAPISVTTVIAILIGGVNEVRNPRICWHCYKQEILVVGVGKFVLKIDTNRVGKIDKFSAETPLLVNIDNLIDGIQMVGSHDGEVTDLSMCQWMTTRLVSASLDGTIKIWEDHKSVPLVVMKPYNGQPVFTASFLTAPTKPDHIVLVTGGSLNREVKIWVSASEEGWLLPSDSDVLRCIQTLKLTSSAEKRAEDAFFNHTVPLPQLGLFLLSNAKRNAIYAVHIDYGPNPESTRMDYIAEFTVTMPILSITGTSDVIDGQSVAQVYCVQTQAIQQYTLDLCQCYPADSEDFSGEKSDQKMLDTVGSDEAALEEQITKQVAEISVDGISMDVDQQLAENALQSDINFSCGSAFHGLRKPVLDNSLADGLETKTSGTVIDLNQLNGQDVVDGDADDVYATVSDELAVFDVETRDNERTLEQEDIVNNNSHGIAFNHLSHLITPSEILMGASSSEIPQFSENDDTHNESKLNILEVVDKIDVGNGELEVSVVRETSSARNEERSSIDLLVDNQQKFCSQAAGLGIDMARERRNISTESYILDESRNVKGIPAPDSFAESNQMFEEENVDNVKDLSSNVTEPNLPVLIPHATPASSKGKKQKGKNFQVSTSSSSAPNALNSEDSFNELVGVSVDETTNPKIAHMEEMLNQLLSSQKEMQKQFSNLVTGPVSKECKRLESVLGKSIEKATKASTDALWARIQEENARNDKLMRERTQQLTNLLTNFINKDMPNVLEKALKKEVATLGTTLAHNLSPIIEKTVSSTIGESFQKGVGDKAVAQLEKSVNSKLEVIVARQIQVQFQTSGKQALQEAFKSGLESSVIPAFDKSCKAMFEQVDSTFQKGFAEHAAGAQQHSQLALTLRDVLNSASTLTQKLNGELIDNQRKLIALASAGANSAAVANPLVMQLSNGPLAEKIGAPLDPTKELNRLIIERKYDDAFNFALQRSDVSMVSWLCSQVDLHSILAIEPMPLSQGVLLSLLQQLGCDIGRETGRKLVWMTDVAGAINPSDSMIAMHIRPISEQVLLVLRHLRSTTSLSGPDNSAVRILTAVVTSFLAH